MFIHVLNYELITGISIAQYYRPVYFNITRSQSKLQILLHLCEMKQFLSNFILCRSTEYARIPLKQVSFNWNSGMSSASC